MYMSTHAQAELLKIVAEYVDTFRRELFTDVINREFNIDVNELDAVTHSDTLGYFIERLDEPSKAEVYADVAAHFHDEIIYGLESGLVDKIINDLYN